LALLVHQQRLEPPSWAALRTVFGFGWVVGGSRIFSVVHHNMDRLIVGVILGPALVSLVEIAAQVQNGVDAVLSAAEAPVVPAAAWLAPRSSGAHPPELLFPRTKYAA